MASIFYEKCSIVFVPSFKYKMFHVHPLCFSSQEFVDLYTDFLLNKHIECQFREFKLGFDMVTNDSSLTFWFTPEELDLLVCGSRVSPACVFFHTIWCYISVLFTVSWLLFVSLLSRALWQSSVQMQTLLFIFNFFFNLNNHHKVKDLWFLSSFQCLSNIDSVFRFFQDFNFHSLEDATEYDGGYTRSSQVIK